MDYLRKAAGTGEQKQVEGGPQGQPTEKAEGGGGFLGGIGNKLNAAAGGGPESEKNEDFLDKGPLSVFLPFCSLK